MNPETQDISQNQILQQPSPQPTDVATPSPSQSRFSKKYILGGIIILILIIIGITSYFLLHKSDNYTFTIDNTSVSEKDFKDIYTYYKNNEFKTSDNKTVLNLVKQLYIKNYVYKKTYLNNTSAIETLQSKLANYSYPTSLNNAPQSLKHITAENDIMQQELIKKVGVKIRSGNILTLGLSQNTATAQDQQRETFMQQKLASYSALLNIGIPFNQVKTQFLADTQITAQPFIQQNANTFIQMPASHPFMPGDDFLDKVFTTPLHKASGVFKAASGNTVIFGIIYPTSPLITGNYIDLQEWLNVQEKNVHITTDFSDF